MSNTYAHYTIVQASAGSGKTYNISDRLAVLIAENNVEPARVIATTFTNDAAAELRERIATRLIERGLVDKAQEINSALVGTVNSITDTIVRRFALEAGISPDVTVIAEQAERSVFNQSCAPILAAAESENRELLWRTGYNEAPRQPGQNFSKLASGKAVWQDSVREIISLMRANALTPLAVDSLVEESMRSFALALPETVDSTDPEPVAEVFARVIRGVYSQLDQGLISTRSKKKLEKERDTWFGYIDYLHTHIDDIPWDILLQNFDGKQIRGTSGAPSKVITDAFAEALNPVLTLASFRSDMESLIHLTFNTAADCLQEFQHQKTAAGFIDFIDQETIAMQLLEREDVKQWIRESFSILVVDEFQDTSPIQLAIFLKIGELVDKVLWVGDPKQSIYAFRGADPVLMKAAAEAINKDKTEAEIQVNTLHHSWRSLGRPLALSNSLFSRVFGEQENVTLDIPDARRAEFPDIDNAGAVEVWNPIWADSGRSQENLMLKTSIIKGIRQRKAENQLDTDESIAVLVRSNSDVLRVLEALREAGIPATGAGVDAADSLETILLLASLRFVADTSDTAALLEMITLITEHPAYGEWFSELANLADHVQRRELLNHWANAPELEPVLQIAQHIGQLSPAQALIELVDALDLRARITSWGNSASRYGTILGIIDAAFEWQDEQATLARPATVVGYLRYLDQTNAVPTAKASGQPSDVLVTTMHRAKGLDWDTVIIALKAKQSRKLSGVWLEPASASKFSLDRPLAQRHICFWPITMQAAIQGAQGFDKARESQSRRVREKEEIQRLAYVAFTRSKQTTVLVPTVNWEDTGLFKNQDSWLNHDVQEEIVRVVSDDGVISASVPAVIRQFEITKDPLPATELTSSTYAQTLPAHRGVWSRPDTLLPARFQPSASIIDAEQAASIDIRIAAQLGEPLITSGNQNWDLVGEAVHSYLATPYPKLSQTHREELATSIIRRWDVANYVSADILIEVGRRWDEWINQSYQSAARHSEVPIRIRTEAGQIAQGWVDMLLKLNDDSLILIDHKSFPGKDPIQHVRENYLGQMLSYAHGIAAANNGMLPARILMHLPLAGVIVEVFVPLNHPNRGRGFPSAYPSVDCTPTIAR